jgi:hypothetical protein
MQTKKQENLKNVKKAPNKFSLFLSITCLGMGLFQLLSPSSANDSFGWQIEDAKTRDLTFRVIGLRDISFSLAFFASRNKPSAARLWLRIFSLALVVDAALAYRAATKPKASPKAWGGVVSSLIFGVAALWSSAKQKETK